MKNIRSILRILLAIVFVVSTFLLLMRGIDYFQGDDVYDSALELAGMDKKAPSPKLAEKAPEPAEPDAPIWVPIVPEDDANIALLETIGFSALREVNPDVIGWILIPDTKINYPIVQTDNNDYYLEYTWDNQKNIMGAIFMECQNRPDFTQFNTIIYGHNMQTKTMFGTLNYYMDQSHFDDHPYVYIASDAGVYRYEIFSGYEAPVESNTYGLDMQWDSTKQKFIGNALELSRFESGITPAITDRILTLSTCNGLGYTTRWVVHARLEMVQVSP